MIRTARLVLRPFSDGDAGWVAREIAVPEVQRWLHSVPHPYAVADAQRYIAEYFGARFYKVIERDGAALGAVTIDPDDGPDLWPELGFWLRRSAWGQGVMTEAAAALIGHYFTTTQGPGLRGGFVDGNLTSAWVQDKLGFVLTGVTVAAHSHFLNAPVRVVRAELTREAWQDL